MNEANSLLEQILQGYVRFHATMKDKSLQHPSDVKEELSKYDTALCQYLGVSRDPPVQKVRAWICLIIILSSALIIDQFIDR